MQENINQMRNVQIADRERLLKEQTKSLEEWLQKENKTEPEVG
jgi:hypothetical protein